MMLGEEQAASKIFPCPQCPKCNKEKDRHILCNSPLFIN